MRIKHDKELLDPAIRKAIIEEILATENRARKDEAYKRYLSLKDKTDRFVTELLLDQFDQTTVKQMSYAMTNVSLVRKVIDKLARVYSHGVERKISNSESETEKLSDLEDKLDFNTNIKKLNKYVKAQRNAMAYIKPCESFDEFDNVVFEPKLSILSPHLYDVVENYYDRTKPMAVILSNYQVKQKNFVSIEPAVEGRVINTPQPPPKGDGKDQIIADVKEDEDLSQFIFWSDNYHFTCNRKGEIVDAEMMPLPVVSVDEILNPIEELPFVNLAIEQDDSFWAEGGKDLVDGGIMINAMLTNMNHISVVQGYGQFYMKGKNLPRTVLTGPDKAILLEYGEDDPIPDIGYVNANPQLSELRQNIEMLVALMLTTNNLSTNGIATQLNGSGSLASGIALVIDKSESQEDVQDQQQMFRDAEPDIWRKVSKWISYFDSSNNLKEEYKGLNLVEGFEKDFVIDFGHPQVILSESEKLDNIQKRQDLGLNTRAELLMKDQPGLSLEEAQEKLAEIDAEKQAKMDSFTSKIKENNDEIDAEKQKQLNGMMRKDEDDKNEGDDEDASE